VKNVGGGIGQGPATEWPILGKINLQCFPVHFWLVLKSETILLWR